jgi:hypothetical protein
MSAAAAPSVTICGRSLGRPGHLCAFFDSREQEYDVLAPFYKEGLDAGEEVINIVDAHRHDDHCRRLARYEIPVEQAITAGALKVLTAEDTYTAGGRFDAQRMYDLLQTALVEARHHGRRVRASGIMDWSRKGTPGTEALMEYEARVNVLVPMYDCTLMCVYDIASISGQEMMDILLTHPFVVNRRRVLENPYYVAPIDLLKEQLLDSSVQLGSQTPPQLS